MKLDILGRWSSNLVQGERNVSLLLDQEILLDCGPHVTSTLLERGLDPLRIELALISHLHLDHFVGIAELFWYRSIYRAERPLLVVGPKGIRESTRDLLALVRTPQPWYGEQIDVKIEFREEEATDSVQVFHGNHAVPDCGYRVTRGGTTLFYSGDTTYCEEIVEGARGVDCLIHEMTYTDENRELAAFWGHSTSSDLMRVFEESGARRVVPVHLTRSSQEHLLRTVGTVKGLVYPPDTLEL